MLIQLIGHTTYALLALSYLVRDIYWLRLIAIPASLCSITFCYFNSPEPVWLIICWNIVFLTVNVWQVGTLHWQRRCLNQCGELSRFVDLLGPSFSTSDAALLMQHGELREFATPTVLFEQGKPGEAIYFVWSGSPEICVGGKSVSSSSVGDFLGEIAFLTKEPCTATVSARPGDKLLCWETGTLASLMSRRPSLRDNLNMHLSMQLRKKLQFREQQIASLQVEASSRNVDLVSTGA